MKNGKEVRRGETRVHRKGCMGKPFISSCVSCPSSLSWPLGSSLHLYVTRGFKSSEREKNRTLFDFYKKFEMRDARRNRFCSPKTCKCRGDPRLRRGCDREFLRRLALPATRRHTHREGGTRCGDSRARPPDFRQDRGDREASRRDPSAGRRATRDRVRHDESVRYRERDA